MTARSIIVLAVSLLGIAMVANAFPKTTETGTNGISKKASIRKTKGNKKRAVKDKVVLKKIFSTKPLEKGSSVKWTHAPFAKGDCSICHEKNDPKKPGPMKVKTNTSCLSCHEQQKGMLKNRKFVHAPVSKNCSFCHNPHNSQHRQLLYAPPKKLCTTCHVRIRNTAMRSKVRHDAVTKQRACRNCHAPHATNINNLLRSPPLNLCLKCHGTDNLKDDKGRPMSNFKKLRKERPHQHEPFAKKDCSVCHLTHGGKNYRMLVSAFPESFYAPYEKETYGLCFKCHREEAIIEPKTTVLTGFRDNDNNLHYLHVKKVERGRTCRTCHQEHAAKQEHLIRDGVPYGQSGWKLNLNYQKMETGGSCTKTCHDTKTYDNGGVPPLNIEVSKTKSPIDENQVLSEQE